MRMLFTNKGLVRKDMRQGNGRVTHWLASGYTRLLKRRRASTTVPAGWDTYCRRDQLSLNKNLPQANCCRRDPRSEENRPHANTSGQKHPTPYSPPPPPGLPLLSASYKGLFSCTCALSSVWATSPGPDPWGFFQLDHFILHPKLLVIGWLFKLPQMVTASWCIGGASWEGSHKPVLNVMCWLGKKERKNEWVVEKTRSF